MRLPASFIPVCVFCLFLSLGCSGEDPSSAPTPSPKVVQTIKQVPPEQSGTPATTPGQKNPQPQAGMPAQPPQEPEATTKNEAIEQPAGGTSADKTPAVAAPSEPPKAQSTQAGGRETEVQEPKAEEPKAEEQEGYYSVKKGDSLMEIAGRKDTMQDPLKWPILLRLNRDKLSDLPVGEGLATWELSPGTPLRFITPSQAKEALKGSSEPLWVVNVISAPKEAEIVPPAAKLAKLGYPVYITRASVKGTEYLRLRVGFFADKKEASVKGEEIKELLKLKDFWLTKANHAEYQDVAGFLKVS